MPNSILSSIFSTAKFTATDSDTGFTLWPNMKVVEVEIANRSANSDQPMSIEQYSNDTVYQQLKDADVATGKIIMPAALRVSAIAPDLSTLEAIIASFANTQLTIDITSKSVISSSMAVVSLEVEQTPKMLTASRVVIEMEQTLPPQPGGFDPEQSGDQNTYGVRIQTLPSVTTTITSLYSRVSSLFGA